VGNRAVRTATIGVIYLQKNRPYRVEARSNSLKCAVTLRAGNAKRVPPCQASSPVRP